MSRVVILLFLTLSVVPIFGHYVPGIAPVNYCTKEDAWSGCSSRLELFVNRLDSDETVLPYEYNHFDFCVPSYEMAESPTENLGQVLFGERIRPSMFNINFKEQQPCSVLCEKTYKKGQRGDAGKLHRLKRGMKHNYQHHWILDNMPVNFCFLSQQELTVCAAGFPMGCYVTPYGQQMDACVLDQRYREPDTYYLFNHVDITIEYHDLNQDMNTMKGSIGGRIVAIKVIPRSVKHESKDRMNCGYNAPPMAIHARDEDFNVVYSYSVTFKESAVKWSHRWDYILDSMPPTNVHSFSIMNSSIIVLVLTIMLAVILRRVSCRQAIADCSQPDNVAKTDTSKESSFVGGLAAGQLTDWQWQSICGDVFRPPPYPMVFSAFLGSGAQIFSVLLVTLFIACLGLLSPASRGAFVTCALLLYVFFGLVAGYVSARSYKVFGGVDWKANVVMTSLLCPGVVFVLFLVANAILWREGSSAAVPLGTIITLIGLWLAVFFPLTLLGASEGWKKPSIAHPPVHTNRAAREIPNGKLPTKPWVGLLMGGVLPFGCIFIQFFFILNSIWAHQVYYQFGFLIIVFLILIVTVSESTILLCYSHLCAEDHRWMWRSFMTSGFTAGWLFLYCGHYFISRLTITGFASTILYFIYTSMFVFIFFLLTGTIGFFACLWFVQRMYNNVKNVEMDKCASISYPVKGVLFHSQPVDIADEKVPW